MSTDCFSLLPSPFLPSDKHIQQGLLQMPPTSFLRPPSAPPKYSPRLPIQSILLKGAERHHLCLQSAVKEKEASPRLLRGWEIPGVSGGGGKLPEQNSDCCCRNSWEGFMDHAALGRGRDGGTEGGGGAGQGQQQLDSGWSWVGLTSSRFLAHRVVSRPRLGSPMCPDSPGGPLCHATLTDTHIHTLT